MPEAYGMHAVSGAASLRTASIRVQQQQQQQQEEEEDERLYE